jgi:hypothetical protein
MIADTAVGIDVSKDTLDICVLSSKQEEKYIKIQNTKEDIKESFKDLAKYHVDRRTPLPAVGIFRHGGCLLEKNVLRE